VLFTVHFFVCLAVCMHENPIPRTITRSLLRFTTSGSRDKQAGSRIKSEIIELTFSLALIVSWKWIFFSISIHMRDATAEKLW
jgi:hypothetical protein